MSMKAQCLECLKTLEHFEMYDKENCISCAKELGIFEQPNNHEEVARIEQEVVRVTQEEKAEFDKKAEAKKELAERELARRRLLPFIKRVNPEYSPGWVHADICERLEKFASDVENRKSPRLMITMPPRHGKSEIGSKTFPSWYLGRNAKHEVIICSYAADLAEDFSRKCRDLIGEPKYKSVFKTRLSTDSKSVGKWVTNEGGGLTAAGVGGPITGRGAHVGIIDDPVKNRDEAESETVRQKVKDWYSSAFYTRLAPGGGILIIQCMTGDTPVLMSSGTEKPLRDIEIGDKVATFGGGSLRTSTVRNHTSNGRDSVHKIMTSSGKIVRANKRHPFLIEQDGELKWVRVKNLKSGQKIVTLKGSGASGKIKLAANATSQSVAEVSVPHTTTNGSGLLDTVRHQLGKIRHHVSVLNSNIATALRSNNTMRRLLGREVSAPYAEHQRKKLTTLDTGYLSYASITATSVEKLEGFYATRAISLLNSTLRPISSGLLSSTSDFTTETIISIEYDCEEEVFDVQIDHTENFIANGIVSHNTRWHDDDLAGHLLFELAEAEKEAKEEGKPVSDDVDKWDLVEYPAIATFDELYRKEGEPLHEERYPLAALRRIKRNMIPRDWEALYQQKPVSDDGDYFTRNMFRYYKPAECPPIGDLRVYAAADLAISTKQTADYSVFAVVGIDREQNIWLLDIVRGRWNALGIIERMFEIQVKYNPELFGIETGQIELTLEPFIQKAEQEKGISLRYEKLRTRGVDKGVRARPLQGRMEQNKVYFPTLESTPWMSSLQNELLKFPLGKNDDQVDALAWIGQMIMLFGVRNEKKIASPKTFKDRLSQFGGGNKGKRHKSGMSA